MEMDLVDNKAWSPSLLWVAVKYHLASSQQSTIATVVTLDQISRRNQSGISVCSLSTLRFWTRFKKCTRSSHFLHCKLQSCQPHELKGIINWPKNSKDVLKYTLDYFGFLNFPSAFWAITGSIYKLFSAITSSQNLIFFSKRKLRCSCNLIFPRANDALMKNLWKFMLVEFREITDLL